MIPGEELHASAIGHIAHQVLTRCSVADVIGKTKRGVFLDLKGDLLLFLTHDPYRGPLTVNVNGDRESLHMAQMGESSIIRENKLYFLESGISIQLEYHPVWKPTQPPKYILRPAKYFSDLALQAKRISSDHPCVILLDTATSGELKPIPGAPGFAKQIIHLSQALEVGNLRSILFEMELMLGRGPGLTPLGDDLLLGVLLTISSTRGQQHWEGYMPLFSHSVLHAAGMKTTKISWCLLNCATQGSADERIIRVLDNLIAAKKIPDRDLYELLHWGSSSGIAVLGGMVLALTSLFRKQNPHIRSLQACQIPSRN